MIAVFPSFYLSSLIKRGVSTRDAVVTNDPFVMLKEHDVKVYSEINKRWIEHLFQSGFSEVKTGLNKLPCHSLLDVHARYYSGPMRPDGKMEVSLDLSCYMKVTVLDLSKDGVSGDDVPSTLRPFYVISLSDFDEEGYSKINEETILNLRKQILLDNMELAQAWPLLYRQIACSR